MLHAVTDTAQLVPLWRSDALPERDMRAVAEEVPVAFVYNHATYAVMMATPAALEDFAYGFSLTEGIISHPREIEGLSIVPHPNGVELRMDLAEHRLEALQKRRRRLAGPVGCGLCGIESLDAAMRSVRPVVSDASLAVQDITRAMTAMEARQTLHRATHCAHAAGFWHREAGMLAVREDVGRHNALDKLAGAVTQMGVAPDTGAVVLTSRVSVEMVQKTAALGTAILLAVSAPTATAIRLAEECGLTLIAGVRGDRFEVFTGPERLLA
jgi:FdhD protein